MPYVELHCHSAFSFLDGASLPDELVAAALERGHNALALTDHDSVSGSMEFAQAARDAGGLRAIHGAEVTVTDAASEAADPTAATSRCSCATPAGWRNLCRLLTRAHAHTRVYASERPVARREGPGACAARRRGPRAWWASRASRSRTSRRTPRGSSA